MLITDLLQLSQQRTVNNLAKKDKKGNSGRETHSGLESLSKIFDIKPPAEEEVFKGISKSKNQGGRQNANNYNKYQLQYLYNQK